MPLTPATSYISGNWRDRLTSYDGQTITYDDIGNPLTYLGYGFTWENGRQLSYIYDEVTFASVAAYEYNGDGIRTAKVVDGVRYEYILDGTQVLAIAYELEETVGSVTYPVYYLVQFTYDESGAPVSMRYIERKSTLSYRVDQTFYYVKNLQGDVVALANAAGTIVATYTYDAWGNQTIICSSGNAWIAEMNPFRYRGYFYDTETGFYYLNSRYYDPEVGRFISADGYVSTGQGLLGNNMYAYCNNNPANMIDPDGRCGRFLGFLWKVDCKQTTCPDSKKYIAPKAIDPIGTYNKGRGNVYIVTEEELDEMMKDLEKNAVIILDKRTSADPNMQIQDSYKIKSRKRQREIAQLMIDYNAANPVDPAWNRTLSSLVTEWRFHNFAYAWGIERTRTADCDFNNADEGVGFLDFVLRAIK